MTLVIDAATGNVLDLGIGDQYPRLVSMSGDPNLP
jgi:hypothetical protein